MGKIQDICGTVQSTQLEANLGRTIIGGYISKIDDVILEFFQQGGENVAIPTLDYLLDYLPNLDSKLIRLYNMNMGAQEGVQYIPDNVKIAQGALFDGLCFGYDVENESVALYTMNFGLLNKINETGIDMSKQCIEKNLKGEVKGYRIDVSYNNSSNSFSFKAVNHRKVLDNSEEGVLLVPYIAVVRMMKIIESMLNGNSVLRVRQEIGGNSKVRCITKNLNVLKKFCDNEKAVESANCSFFPLKAFFYAPVLGAPSLSSMVTNINIFKLCELRPMRNLKQLKYMGIEKPEDPVESMMMSRIISFKILKMKSDNPVKLLEVLAEFPKSGDYLGGVSDVSMVDSPLISGYLHSLTNSELNEVMDMIPYCREEYNYRMEVFNGNYRNVQESELVDLNGLLKRHICRFIIRKSDCSLSSIICTNNRRLLSKIYGEDYFNKYESFGVRLNYLLSDYEEYGNLRVALREYGFDVDENEYSLISKTLSKASDLFSDDVRKEVSEILGIPTKKSSRKSTGVMVRTLDGYISEKIIDSETGEAVSVVNDYYRSIDPEKIVSAIILA